MISWYRGFTGQVVRDSSGDGFRAVRVACKTSYTSIDIVELTVGVWTRTYKDTVLNPVVINKRKIIGYTERHNGNCVLFQVVPSLNVSWSRLKL
jgi:hypothetical protein